MPRTPRRAAASPRARPGATMPNVASATSRTWFSYERIIAPGWNAVIWLSSRSVVMNACARVEVGRTPCTQSRRISHAREVLAVRREILADGRHRQRIGAEQLEVVGDVAGAAAELAAHARHQERHVQDVHLVGQDVVLELVLEHHDGVVGQRSADECRHAWVRGEWVAEAIAAARIVADSAVGSSDHRPACCDLPGIRAPAWLRGSIFENRQNPAVWTGIFTLFVLARHESVS